MKIEIRPEQVESWVAKYFDSRPRKGGDELLICNPFNGDTGYHFNISTIKCQCHDWRGDEWAGYNPNSGKRNGCTFLRFVQRYLEHIHGSCSFSSAVEDVLGSSSSVRSMMRTRKAKELRESQEKASLCLPGGATEIIDSKSVKLAKAVQTWLKSRGIGEDKLRKYGVMHSGLDVVWPYYEYDELVYWQSRSRLDKKFLFPPESVGVTKGQFLYGYDQVEPASYVAITEAIFCCQTLETQALASGGAILTDMQVKKLKIIGPRDGVVLAPDNDIPGLESIFANASKLKRSGFKVFFSVPPAIKYKENGVPKHTKDWNDIIMHTDEDVRKIFEERVMPFGVKQNLKLRTVIDMIKKGTRTKPKIQMSGDADY